jgi:hypothetical protein
MSNLMKIRPVGAELFCADAQTGMTLLTGVLRNCGNAPKITFARTNILFSTYVQVSQFCWCPVDTCYRQTATAVRLLPSAVSARPLSNRNSTTSLPSGSHNVNLTTYLLRVQEAAMRERQMTSQLGQISKQTVGAHEYSAPCGPGD